MKFLRSKKSVLLLGLILIFLFEVIRISILINYSMVDSYIKIMYVRFIFIVLFAGLIIMYLIKFRIKDHLIMTGCIIIFILYTLNLVRIEAKEISIYNSFV